MKAIRKITAYEMTNNEYNKRARVNPWKIIPCVTNEVI